MIDQLSTKRHAYQQNSYSQPGKQNIPLRVNYDTRKDKKFAYGYQSEKRQESSNRKTANGLQLSKDEQIQRLKQQLREQREKVKYLQTTIISEQSTVLNQLEMLQSKFQEVTSEKHHLELELHKIRNSKRNSLQENQTQWKEKYQQLEIEHKKVKNITNSLIDMMKKVDGIEGGVHQAWKWTKKVVWEYESIRKKALEWKTVYDQVTQAVNILQHHNQ